MFGWTWTRSGLQRDNSQPCNDWLIRERSEEVAEQPEKWAEGKLRLSKAVMDTTDLDPEDVTLRGRDLWQKISAMVSLAV